MNLIELLKTACHQDHMQIREGEGAQKIMQHTLSEDEYIDGLLINYLFHFHLEKEIEQHLPAVWKKELDWEKRKKIHYIQRDLKQFNKEHLLEELMKQNIDFIQVNTPSEALGILYVMEGTAIGGAIIKRNLQKLDWVIEQQLDIYFYGCYNKELSYLWKQFCAFMMVTSACKEEVIAKAKEAFKFYQALQLFKKELRYQLV